jgi:hypothetical protein
VWDVTGSAGIFIHHPEVEAPDAYYDDWYSQPLGAVVLGRHFGPHFKLELDVSASGEGRQYISRSVAVPQSPLPILFSAERYSDVREVGVLATWQFFENEWIHPFVQGGVIVDVERVRWLSYPTFPRGPAPPFVPPLDEDVTRTTAGGLVGLGAKLYISERVFIRPDGRFGINSRGHHVTLRAGLGVDF